jgi:thioredoxin-related protein
MKKNIIIAVIALLTAQMHAQTIQWLDFEKAVKESDKASKKKKDSKIIFVDVYTDWCGWCKRMDATTFADPIIADYMNKNFLSVKFNAEGNDTVCIGNEILLPKQHGKTHALAAILLNGKMSYPSYTFLEVTDENKIQIIQVVPGYQQAKQFEYLINFFGSGAYKTKNWEDFQKEFVPKIQ